MQPGVLGRDEHHLLRELKLLFLQVRDQIFELIQLLQVLDVGLLPHEFVVLLSQGLVVLLPKCDFMRLLEQLLLQLNVLSSLRYSKSLLLRKHS